MGEKLDLVFVAAFACMAAAPAHGAVIEFTDRAQWEAAVGRFTTIDFTGFPENTIITNQYEDLGVTFADGNDSISLSNAFPNDGAGLAGGFPDDIEVLFTTPILWIAVNFPGLLQFELFHEGALVYTSSVWDPAGTGNFFGLLSTEPFDAAVMTDLTDDAVFIDDLHFGVPAPPTLALLGLAVLIGGRQGRRRA